MPTYITVLNSELHKERHIAIQWDDNLQSIRNNRFYTAGVNLNIPKSTNDEIKGTKEVTETATLKTGNATIFKVGGENTTLINVARNKAPKTFIAKLK